MEFIHSLDSHRTAAHSPRRRDCPWLSVGLAAAVVAALFSAQTANAEAITIDNSLTETKLGKSMAILEDPSTMLTIEDVTVGPKASAFQKSKSDKPNFGFTKSAFWVRFELRNDTEKPRHLLLELNNAILDEITLYQPKESGAWDSLTLGDHSPFENRTIPNRNPVFEIELPAQGSKVYYTRLFTDGSMQIDLLIHDPVTFFKRDHNAQMVFGLYAGIVLVMALYNLFLFFAVRDRTYVYYVAFILGVLLFNTTVTGVAYEYLLHTIPFPSLINKTLLMAIAVIGGTGTLFTISFLKTKETAPRLHKFLVGFAFAFVPLFIAVLVFPYGPVSKVCALLTVAFGGILTGAGIYLLSKGYRSARFYVVAWIAFLAGCLLQAARFLGVVPHTFITLHGMEVGSVLEVVLLSLALADRISIMKAEKEKAQREAIESFKKADRIKDEFLANTSHELRTPLNGIIGIAESLIDGATGQLAKSTKENLGMIVGAGQRLSALVNDILDFAKLRNKNIELQLKPVALKQLVDVEIALLSPLLGAKKLELKNEVPAELKAVHGDENRLVQILQNVIGNAIKFTESGSIKIRARQEGDMVSMEIIDTGIGIPADRIDEVFKPFEQADGSTARQFGGTGIGLSITKQLVELHGGTITAKSELGKGTTMLITLPTTDENAQSAAASSKLEYLARPVDVENAEREAEIEAAVPVISGTRSLNILAVDDEPLNLKVLTNQLSLHGHKVTLGRDGEEALRKIEEEGKPDLVLLDVMMPRVTGLDVCKKLREKYGPTELPIILLTAKNQLSDLLNGFTVGANDYLTKPFSSREVLARVQMHTQIADFASALALANEELRVQIAKRSEQLFSTLALIGQGTRETQELEQGAIISERYKIVRFVGEGGMGSVYEATVLSNQQRAALKVAKSGDPLALALLAQEARMAIEVVHENIVRIIDVDVAKEGFLYVVMEFLDGPTLSEQKDQWGDLDWGLKVLGQICQGLMALHSHNLVHRDLKPENIVVSRGDAQRGFNVKIVDFGISSWSTTQQLEIQTTLAKATRGASLSAPPVAPAKEEEQPPVALKVPLAFDFADGGDTIAPTRAAHTGTGRLTNEQAGTPRFMAPEQIQLGTAASQSTDIWAVGVIAHRILAKTWPFSDEAFVDLLTGVETPEVDSIRKHAPRIDAQIAQAVDRCLDLDPQKRPTAKELVELISSKVRFSPSPALIESQLSKSDSFKGLQDRSLR